MKKQIILGVSLLLLWSCNETSNTTGTEADTHTEADAAHHAEEGTEAIELNQGEKWRVNEEMKPFIAKGSALVDAYIQESSSEYKTLAAQLKEQNNALIKSCTMEGKSHDELHKWLHPHLETVKALEEETDATKAREIVGQLQHSYQEYHQYFQ